MTIFTYPGVKLQGQVPLLLDAFDQDSLQNASRAGDTDPLNVKKIEQSFQTRGILEECPLPTAVKGPNGRPLCVDGAHRFTAALNLGWKELKFNYYVPDDPSTFDYEHFLMSKGLESNDHVPAKPISTADFERAVAVYVDNNIDTFKTEAQVLNFVNGFRISSIVQKTKNNIAKRVFLKKVNTSQIKQFDKRNAETTFRKLLKGCEIQIIENISGPQGPRSTIDPVIKAIKHYQLHGEAIRYVILTKNCESMNDVVKTRSEIVKTWEREYNMLREVIYEVDDQESGYQIEYPFEIVGAIPQVNGQESVDKLADIA
jgi:hemoglobin-like flavoprotein